MPCNKCTSKENIKAGIVDLCISKCSEAVYLEMFYDAYSVDSSFDDSDAYIEIKFCPFCGERLHTTTAR